ncbi:phage tail fiber protein [Pseudomonas sp. EA_65y_Pfl1_P120]|uniref:phage tail fiber protein n=1 Tax=Pseudomonas sp. EA_65y_Pfl1_P120 TaxID=3088693 RepID=UPI0030DB9FA9
MQNGSNTVIGTNLDFAASSRNGDSFIGPDGASYEVANVASSTVISILPAYRGPTVSGAPYAIMPVQGYDKLLSDAFNALVNQFGQKLAALGTTGNYDVLPANKGGTGINDLSAFIQTLLNDADAAAGRVTLGAAKSGENTDITSLGGLTTALSVAQGGTGGQTQAAARTGLGIGTAAVKTVGTAAGNIQDVSAPLAMVGNSAFAEPGSHFIAYGDSTSNAPAAGPYWAGMRAQYPFQNAAIDLVGQVIGAESMNLMYRSVSQSALPGPWRKIYHDGNTTRGSGGALSAASPIVRIANVADSARPDLQENMFEPAGDWGVANDQAQGVLVERLSVGEYRITGSLGLAFEGWRTHDPISPDGGRSLGITESQQDEAGVVTVRLFRQRWTLTDDGEMVPGRGAPVDVPLNSWIDVRLEMPTVEYPSPPPPLPAIAEE